MRAFRLLLMSACGVVAGPIGFGVKAGLPATDLVMSSYDGTGAFPTRADHYVIGPVAKLRSPFGRGVEDDALYRRVSNPSIAAWKFPILAKYRFRGRIAPFVAGGVSFQRNDALPGSLARQSASRSPKRGCRRGSVSDLPLGSR